MFVFVVGLPRSGTTLLSSYINQSEDSVSLNDFYLIPKIRANFELYKQDSETFSNLIASYLTYFFKERFIENTRFEGQLERFAARAESIISSVGEIKISPGLSENKLVLDIYCQIKAIFGVKNLVDKTPQNFFHYEFLKLTFPDFHLIYVFRHPLDVARSLKLANFKGHDSRRYHPVIYGIYWNQLFQSFLRCDKKHTDIIFYEELATAPQIMLEKLEKIKGLLPVNITRERSNNSSGGAKDFGATNGLSALESRIISRITQKGRLQLGYEAFYDAPKYRDFLELAVVSLRFMLFQIKRFVADIEARHRITLFLRSLGNKIPSGSNTAD
jgi:hypothetical protein